MLTPTVPAPAPIPYALANRSTVYSDHDCESLAEALQIQFDRDYGPLWHDYRATVHFFPRGRRREDQSHRWVTLVDRGDQAGAEGWHELTPWGLPAGIVGVMDTLEAGDEVSVTTSHEILEMAGDPLGQSVTMPVSTPAGWGVGRQSVQVILENADACEAKTYAYQIGAVTVSDFVTPAWFNPAAPAGTRFDFGGHIQRPLEILPGGYISYRTADGEWHQVFAADSPLGRHRHAHGPAAGSRLARLMKPRSEWRHSTGS